MPDTQPPEVMPTAVSPRVLGTCKVIIPLNVEATDNGIKLVVGQPELITEPQDHAGGRPCYRGRCQR